ncbi:hypothetical protein [Tenacibaculum sp.]|uniref:hypothetical protein n=1 Tax=Tenacibaculum sp. TaxID=1906242 RepID=UPI003AA9728E
MNLKLLDQISKISFVDIDDVMINGYGFKKMKEENGMITYMKFVNDDVDNFLIINIIDSKNYPYHSLDISIGKKFSKQKFIDNLIEEGYLYNGSNDYGFSTYKKEDTYYLISKEPNKAGSNQILKLYNE